MIPLSTNMPLDDLLPAHTNEHAPHLGSQTANLLASTMPCASPSELTAYIISIRQLPPVSPFCTSSPSIEFTLIIGFDDLYVPTLLDQIPFHRLTSLSAGFIPFTRFDAFHWRSPGRPHTHHTRASAHCRGSEMISGTNIFVHIQRRKSSRSKSTTLLYL
jgi:hypothetical protein